jgi:hypothetical protein
MRLRTTILLFGLLTWGQTHGQLILTETENSNWTEKLRAEKDLNKQLDLLRSRILADTNVYIKPLVHYYVSKSDRDKNKSDGLCKPLLIVSGQIINIQSETPTKKIKELVNALTTDNIKELNIAHDNQAIALYGSSGRCGLIMLTAKNKKAKKVILRING